MDRIRIYRDEDELERVGNGTKACSNDAEGQTLPINVNTASYIALLN